MEIFQMSMYIYIVVVSSLEKHNFPFIIFLSIISTLILTPLLLLLYLVCWSYKQLVKYLIQKVYSDSFIDFMEGLDSICCNQINCILNVLLPVESTDDIQTLFGKTLTLIKSAIHSDHKKLFYSRGSFLGYHYFYKNHLQPKDYILQTTEQISISSKQHLSEVFHKYDTMPMPDNNRALLQVILFSGSIKIMTCSNVSKMVAFRLHHCLGDAKAIINLFVSVFGDVEISLSVGTEKRKYSDLPVRKLTSEINRLKEWPSGLVDDNPLRGYNLTEQKHVAWYSDDDKDCMTKIKNLRKKLPGITFLDVVNTCISSSLYDHYENHGIAIPTTVIGGVILSPAVYSFNYGVGKFTMTNRFSCAAFHMPIALGDCKIFTRLKHIKKEYDYIKKCVDVQFNYWVAQNICQAIPAPIVRIFCEKVPVTFGVSSFPGCEKFTLFAGAPVRDFIFMAPNSPYCGLHFVIYTYDGNFRIVLSADSGVIKTHQEAQQIVDNVIEYLNELHTLCLNNLFQI